MSIVREPSCAFCNKHGLLILPLRYAVVPSEWGQPQPAAPLRIEDAATSVGNVPAQSLGLSGSASYTTRVLRSGYLYVYDEQAAELLGYWVSVDGYIVPLPKDVTTLTDAPMKPTCNTASHPAIASCISVSPKATGLWLAFSDVLWTAAVQAAHRGDGGRARRELHMRYFDAGRWIGAQAAMPLTVVPERGDVPHAVPMAQLSATVADFTDLLSPRRGPAFEPIGDAFPQRRGLALTYLNACQRRSPHLHPAMIVLDDPVGITQDLAAMAEWRHACLLATPVSPGAFGSTNGRHYGSYGTTYGELVELDAAFATIRTAYDEKVRMQAFDTAGQRALYAKQSLYGRQLPRSMVPESTQQTVEASAARQAIPDLAAIANEQADGWKEYLERVEQPALGRWHARFQADHDALLATHLTPLNEARAGWLRSRQLANTLESSTDGAHLRSGEAYTEILGRCIVGAPGRSQIDACRSVLQDWLGGSLLDKSNLLLRALVVRQDALIQRLEALSLEDELDILATRQSLLDVLAPLLPATSADIGNHMTAVNGLIQAQTRVDALEQEREDEREYQLSRMSPGEGPPPQGYAETQRRLDTARAELNAADDAHASAAVGAKEKSLPDTIAKLLLQLAPAVVGLTQKQIAAGTTTVHRWMLTIGVLSGRVPMFVDVGGTVADMVKATSQALMDALADTAEAEGKPLSDVQRRQLSTYMERQVLSNLRTGNYQGMDIPRTPVRSRMFLFIEPEVAKQLRSLRDPTDRVRHLASHVVTPGSLHDYGMLRLPKMTKTHLAIADAAINAIGIVCQWVSWNQLLKDEAKAMSIEKNWRQDARAYLGGMMLAGGVGQMVATLVNAMSTYRSLHALGLTRAQAAARAAKSAKWIRGIGRGVNVLGGVTSVLDLVDANDARLNKKPDLMLLHIATGITGGGAAAIGIAASWATDGAAVARLGWWGFALALIGWGLSTIADEVRGDKAMQWMERSYWGVLPDDRRGGEGDRAKRLNDMKLLLTDIQGA